MALVATEMKAAMKAAIVAGLAREFAAVSSTDGYAGISMEQWTKLADAISDIALVVVLELTTKAQVAPGIPTAGSPAAQVTVGPGQII